MARRRNPFGIYPGDTLKLALFGGLALYAISKLGELVPKDDSDKVQARAMTLQNVSWGRLSRYGQPIDVEWTVNHLGPAAKYVVGLQFAPASAGAIVPIFGQRGQPAQTIEKVAMVPDDATVFAYVFQTTDTVRVAPGWYDVRGYVREESGTVIVDGWTNGGLVVI